MLKAWWRKWRAFILVFGFALVSIFAFPLLPDRYDPSTPIDLTVAPTFVTPIKMARINRSFPACVNAVRAAGLEVEAHSISSDEQGCGMDQGLLLKQGRYVYGGGVTMTCPMMAALAQWEIHLVGPAAQEHLGTDVSSVVHYGTYSCRNINGALAGPRSAHATGQALDVAGFKLVDGGQVSLLHDWDADDDNDDGKAAFLRDVRDGSCGVFSTVLSPDYNENHKDHFHFEVGGWGICR